MAAAGPVGCLPFRAAYLNVGGLTRHPATALAAYLTTASEHADLILLGETWLADGTTDFSLPGYTAVHCARPRAAGARGRDAGGISAFVHSRLQAARPRITIDPSHDIVWVELQQWKLTVAACYFSPRGSNWYRTHGDPFAADAALTQGLMRAHSQHHRCIIMGDMNARVASLATDVPCVLDGQGPSALALFDPAVYAGVPAQRRSQDNTAQRYGRDLMAVLVTSGLVLLNGRAPGDTDGLSTFTSANGGTSVVDLAAISAGLYTSVTEFAVKAFDVDAHGHSMICMSVMLPSSGRTARRQRGRRVVRPDLSSGITAAEGLDASLGPAAAALKALLPDLSSGALTLDAGLEVLSRAVIAGCRAAADAAGAATGAAIGGDQDWWDSDCTAARDEFVRAWRAFLDARNQAAAATPGDGQLTAPPTPEHVQALRLAALGPRAAFNSIKRRKKAAWLEAREKQAIEAYFSTRQRDFWSWFRGAPRALSLLDVGVWTDHFRSLLVPHEGGGAACPPDLEGLKTDFFEHSSRSLPETDLQAMNAEITAAEVQAVLAGLKSGKAAGPDGLTNEALKLFVCAGGEACTALTECLAVVLNACRLQQLPARMCMGKLVPVPKGKPSVDPGKHRGIVVSNVYSRLLDSILYRRGNKISKDLDLRAVTQCGFKDGHGTLDALFLVQHLIDKCRHSRRRLLATTADITKAFDCVSRTALLDRCHRLGFHGAYCDLLARTYERICVAVHVAGESGESIETGQGTKQGSELSPLIFGWFIEQFAEFVVFLAPDALGVTVGGVKVSHILYADDIMLLADSVHEMQRLLDLLATFCKIFGLTVNLEKTKSMCFCPPQRMAPLLLDLTYNGTPLTQVAQLDYLGLTFDCKQGLYLSNQASALAKGRQAMFALTAQLRRRRLRTPDFARRLFDLLVAPTFSYGCQIWGPDKFVEALCDPMSVGLQRIPLEFARTFCGLGSSAHRMTLLRELGMFPVFHHWLCLAVRLWNRLKGMDGKRLFRIAFEDNLKLALGGCKKCWVGRMLAALAELDLAPATTAGLSAADLLALDLDEAALKDRLQTRFLDNWPADLGQPREAPSQGVLAATYARWVGMGPGATSPHLHTSLPYTLRRVLVGFRVGAHALEVVSGRFRGVAREDRVCKVHTHDEAHSPHVEDLRHFLLECPHYQPIRDAHPRVFANAAHAASANEQVQAVFRCASQWELAECLQAMLAARTARLEQLDLVAGGGQ